MATVSYQPFGTGHRPVLRTNPYLAARLSGARGMGASAASAQPTPVDPNYNLAASLLLQANSGIKELESLYAANGAQLGADIGTGIQELRSSYESILQGYIAAYSTAFGAAPNTTGMLGIRPGIARGPYQPHHGAQLGQWQVYVAAGATIAVLVGYLYVLIQNTNNLKIQAQTALIQAQTAGTQAGTANTLAATYQQLVTQAQAAYSSGDNTTGDALMAQANTALAAIQQAGGASGTPNPPSSWATWLQNNWGTVALTVGAIFVGPSLVDAVLGGKRR